MKTSDFDYYLPDELIAQTPLKKRDSSKLLVLNKFNGSISHKKFTDLIDYLNEGDVLVLNNTKVIPARLIGEIMLSLLSATPMHDTDKKGTNLSSNKVKL